MNLDNIIAEIRARCPEFSGRVAGAAQFKNLDQSTSFPVPAAFVIPLDDEAGEQESKSGYRQDLREAFAVVVAVSNASDERGQTSINQVRVSVREQLWRCLLGWIPEPGYDGVVYEGGAVLSIDRGRLWYQHEFSAEMTIGAEMTRLKTDFDALPPFQGMDVDVNFIRPESGQPDGETEFRIVINPPQT